MSGLEERLTKAEDQLSDHAMSIEALNKLAREGQKADIIMKTSMDAVHSRLDKFNKNQLGRKEVVDILTNTLDANLGKRVRGMAWMLLLAILTPIILAVLKSTLGL